MARSKKATTPQAKRFGVAARAARQACKTEPGTSYFKCVGRVMKDKLRKGKRKAKRK